MSVASVAVPSVSAAPIDQAGLAEKITIRDLNFFYGEFESTEIHHPAAVRA